MAHALFAPSSAHRWTLCPGSVTVEAKLPDRSSFSSEEGDLGHAFGAHRLAPEKFPAPLNVPADMPAHIAVYEDYVRSLPGDRFIEVKVPISFITGEPDASGTSDAIVVDHEHGVVEVVDLKYGMGVKVFAEDNMQLIMYALGAVRLFEFVLDVKRVRMTIVQPRLNHIDTVEMLIEDLREWEDRLRGAAERARAEPNVLVPGDKQCRFCKARSTCPALAKFVTDAIEDEFDAIGPRTVERVELLTPDALGLAMSKVDLIETWCREVRGKVESLLVNGTPVPGYKLVEGRRGARKWKDEHAALDMLRKRFRLTIEQACDLKVISPTSAEKLLKAGDIGPRQWQVLQDQITQGEGKPSVAPESDRRPAISVQATADEFETVAP